MKNDTMRSGSSSSRRQYSKGSYKNPHFSGNRDDIAMNRLKRAVVVLPIIIMLVIISALIIGINQYTSMTVKDSEKRNIVNVPSVVDNSQKLMMVVSSSNPLPSDYKINLIECENIEVDKIIADDLRNMVKAAEKANITLILKEGYVSAEEQHERYMNEIERLISKEGYSEIRAKEAAEKNVPMENHSEQQTGLLIAVDTNKEKDFENSETFNWLIKNSINYGFILRYPENKESYTNHNFNSTLFRYVGQDNAVKIRTFGMCLDEYVSYISSRE